MSLRLLLLVSLLVLLAVALGPRAAAGSVVVVPDDHATVTAAIASGADTILVRDGDYDEAVAVDRSLVLARFDPEGPPETRPLLQVLTLGGAAAGDVHVSQFRFVLPVFVDALFDGPSLWLEDCHLGSGLQHGVHLGPRLRVTGCGLFGACDVYCWSLEFTGNTVIAGGLNAEYESYATIASNWFHDAPGFAITLWDNDCAGWVADNVVWNCVAGIKVMSPCGTRIERNLVEHCAGDGITTEYAGQGGFAVLAGNVVRDAGGNGIQLGSLGGAVLGNTIEHVALAGIRVAEGTPAQRIAGNRVTDAQQAGVLAAGGALVQEFAGNTILRAGGPGALLRGATRADSNVVGRCLGHGIEVDGTQGTFTATKNTLYLNGGSGLVVASESHGLVAANIGYGNGLHALDWSGAGVASLACNLGFGNRAGNVNGAEPGATDREGDPLFCDLPADDVHLGPGSAAILAGCETAGALGPGCTSSAGVGAAAPAAFLRAGPLPARASVRFEWAAGVAARLEVFDLAGAKCWERLLPAGTGLFAWNLRDARGRPLAPGVYFARATSAERTATVKLVVAR